MPHQQRNWYVVKISWRPQRSSWEIYHVNKEIGHLGTQIATCLAKTLPLVARNHATSAYKLARGQNLLETSPPVKRDPSLSVKKLEHEYNLAETLLSSWEIMPRQQKLAHHENLVTTSLLVAKNNTTSTKFIASTYDLAMTTNQLARVANISKEKILFFLLSFLSLLHKVKYSNFQLLLVK